MPLKIIWQSPDLKGERTQFTLRLLDANLIVTLLGDVIVGATWDVVQNPSLQTVSSLGELVQAYLLNPYNNQLQLTLRKQGSTYAQLVWNALLEIPAGQVSCYSDLAASLGSGPRAIAQACKNNPYAGIIPCHRVVSKTGIGGFMGQSTGAFIDLKRRLLLYEQNIASDCR